MSDVYAGSLDAPAPNRSEEMETAVLAEIMLGGRPVGNFTPPREYIIIIYLFALLSTSKSVKI